MIASTTLSSFVLLAQFPGAGGGGMMNFLSMAGFFFGFFIYILVLPPILLLMLAVPYAVLRVRDSGPPDPQLGLKAGLYFFFSLAIFLVLNGLTIIAVDAILGADKHPGEMKLDSDAQKVGRALVASGFGFALLHLVLIKGLTRDSANEPRRIFAGCRFAVHGLVVFITVTILAVNLFLSEWGEGGDWGNKEVTRTVAGVLLVWVPSWALHLAFITLYCKKPTGSRMG